MKFLALGNAQLPALGFGTWQLTGTECTQGVSKAIEIGYRHIDTAQAYENEAQVGEGIKHSGIARAELFVTTKLWTSNFKPERVLTSADESLSRLGMDYVDLLLMHWPNPAVPLGETLGAMQELLAKGTIKAMGVSNFPVALMREAVEKCKAPIVCNQVEYHAMLSQGPVLDYARAHQIIVTAYSPLARSRLAKDPLLAKIGEKYGKTAAQVALRWLIGQKNVAAIPKAATEKNARLNFAIFDFELSPDDQKAIDGLGKNERVINPGFAPKWDAA